MNCWDGIVGFSFDLGDEWGGAMDWCTPLLHRLCLLLNFQLIPTHPSHHFHLSNSPAACQQLIWNEISAKENTWKSHSMNQCINFYINYEFKFVCWLIQKLNIHTYIIHICSWWLWLQICIIKWFGNCQRFPHDFSYMPNRKSFHMPYQRRLCHSHTLYTDNCDNSARENTGSQRCIQTKRKSSNRMMLISEWWPRIASPANCCLLFLPVLLFNYLKSTLL